MQRHYPGVDAVWDLPQAVRDRFGGTPQTYVVSSTGVVEKTWSGAYNADTQAEVESFFSIQLPGLLAPAKPQAKNRTP